MQKDNRLYQLAENVLKNSVKLKKGEKIYIEAFGPAVLDLMEIFIRKATELGGVPFYFYNDEHLLKAVIDNASEEQMKAFGETYRQQMASSDVYVALRGYDDIFALSDVNERQMALYMQHYYNPVHRSITWVAKAVYAVSILQSPASFIRRKKSVSASKK